ncbi:MAG: ABC transporter substrate-binding protein [Candidatus Aminicenantes bacterium]|nr:ABC transporter substrate-binding protein [Candidatus Aminicenantes bacterium]NIM79904.1 ABC transporter substrate-binding protein [Candidatus Aminicenantes bacterium]NIN19241.1 ABC transporter substrate-binding protein [Candidatus Aminicenantes bacterium]NIN43146.1 ABC transporter substrate-binding protein [Candidatus Aminicenantes bacterium]NIN85883.1 ABC transporter substrate-binding protein [Candidatus Aminicenantes bacterium]
MKKNSFKFACFLLILQTLLSWVVFIGCSSKDETRDSNEQKTVSPIILGAPVPRASAYGQNGERGMILAAEEINAAGGVNVGGVKRPLKLEIIDTRDLEPGVPTNEVLLAIEKLILQKKVDLIVGGPCLSEAGMAAMDLYARYDTLDIVSIGCYTPSWDKKVAGNPEKYKNSFRVSGSVKAYIKEGLDLLHQIKETFGFDKIFISIDDSLMCRKAAGIVEDLAAKDGWKIVGKDKHPIGTTDYSTMLIECKKSGAQVLFIWAYAPETSILLKQWSDMEVPALPIGFIGAAEDPGFWDATNGKGAYTVVTISETGNVPGNVMPGTMKFYNAYKKRWNVEPRSTGCVSCYESLYLIKDAIERAGTLNKDALRSALEKSNLPAVRGVIRFDKNHQVIYGYDPNKSVLGCWVQWQDGKRVCIFPKAAATGEIKMPPWLKTL